MIQSTSLVINARFPNFKCEGNRPEQDAIDFFKHASIGFVEIDVCILLYFHKLKPARLPSVEFRDHFLSGYDSYGEGDRIS